jgi:hypothetical protein
MPLTLFDAASPVSETAVYWFYRVGSYLLTHVMDDPAWLALMFC